jgi:hypothetical protein
MAVRDERRSRRWPILCALVLVSSALATTAMAAATTAASSVKVMSWNIRYAPVHQSRRGYGIFDWLGGGQADGTEGEQPWTDRRELIADTVLWEDCDVVGFQVRLPSLCCSLARALTPLQEVLHHQLEDLATLLPDYAYVGVGRDDGKERGEAVPIFYKR